MDWIVPPKDVIMAAQVFSILHGGAWVFRKWCNSPEYIRIRRHARSSHPAHFTTCVEGTCAIV